LSTNDGESKTGLGLTPHDEAHVEPDNLPEEYLCLDVDVAATARGVTVWPPLRSVDLAWHEHERGHGPAEKAERD
jgi:hypothetical protein